MFLFDNELIYNFQNEYFIFVDCRSVNRVFNMSINSNVMSVSFDFHSTTLTLNTGCMLRLGSLCE